ncbi:tetratricopeptide repeat protein [Tautonia marina]|uniref:tetratricopeptide repeat protein n=1 Tax=Tautonia marina TaxID=2653855 RepID=UPI001260482C|nr:tetratricopeptide repeat protein [Tautonia marina]
MSRTARSWKGAGPATLLGCLLTGSMALGGTSPEGLSRQLIDLGHQAEAQGQLDQADRFFRKALELDPTSTQANEGVKLVALRLQDAVAPQLGDEAGASIERAQGLQQVLVDQLNADIRGRINRARALLRQNQPEAAETTLRLALTALETADQVPDSVVDQLGRELRIELLQTIRRSEELAQRQAELIRLESAAQREMDAVSALLRTQATVRELMIQFNTLMNEGVFAVLDNRGTGNIVENSQPFFDARLLAQSANALLPRETAPRAGMFVSTSLGFLSQTRAYEELKEFRYMATMLDVDRASVPFPDLITIEYPPADVFREISEKRIARYEVADLAERSELTLEIQRRLEQPISMPFDTDTPLSDALEYIRQATADEKLINGIPIYVDEIGLQEAEQSLQSPIKMNLDGIPLKTTLRLMLDQLDLSYTVYDDLLEITAKGSERRGTLIRVYPVADLAIIPMSLMMGGGGGGMGMGGGMGGMGMGGMGGGMGGMGMGGMGGGMGGMGGGMGGMMGGGMMSIPVAPESTGDALAPQEKKSN